MSKIFEKMLRNEKRIGVKIVFAINSKIKTYENNE
jgi:hypothetical protein